MLQVIVIGYPRVVYIYSRTYTPARTLTHILKLYFTQRLYIQQAIVFSFDGGCLAAGCLDSLVRTIRVDTEV